jgi:hypothetical protein
MDKAATKKLRLRIKQRYAIVHLRCMLAEDLRNAGVVEGWTNLKVEQLVARLYGSFLDSHLLRPEFRRFYGHFGMQNYRDPFPDGHDGPIPLPMVRSGFSEAEPHIPAGYMEEARKVRLGEEGAAEYIASTSRRRGILWSVRYRLACLLRTR